MELFVEESVAKYNADGVNIDYDCLVSDVLRKWPNFLIESRYKNAGGIYSSQEQRVRGWVSSVCDKKCLSIRAPTHIAQHAAENVGVYQDAVEYANMYLKV